MINRKQVDLEEFLEEIDGKWKLSIYEHALLTNTLKDIQKRVELIT